VPLCDLTHRGKQHLFDRLVGAGRWHVEPDRLGGIEIDDQFELGRLLNRKIAGLCAARDLVDIGGRASPQVGATDAIGRETTQEAAGTVGLVLGSVEARSRDELEVALTAIGKDLPDALLTFTEGLTIGLRQRMANWLPMISEIANLPRLAPSTQRLSTGCPNSTAPPRAAREGRPP
jgi:hypothetical protein